MSDPLLTIDGLDFSYGAKKVLDKICLEVPKGEMILFAGANGAGKTTLLNLMAGVLPSSKRKISLHLEPEKVAHIDTDLSLYKTLSARQAEALHRSLFRSAAVDWTALSRMGISTDTRLGELSRGQKALFRLHLALSQAPQLLMIDEILTNLDPQFQEEMANLLVDLCSQGTTVIAVSQTPGDWQHLYSRLWLLKGSRLIVDQGIDELLARAAMEHSQEPSRPDWPILDRVHQDGQQRIVYYPLPQARPESLEAVALPQFCKSIIRSQAC